MSAGTANDALRAHGFSLENRRAMKIQGVTDAVSFDEQTVVLETACGRMEIGGTGLQVEVLNLRDGVVELQGTVDTITYFANELSEKTRKGLLGALFR